MMSEQSLEFPLTVIFTILALVVVLVLAWLAIRLLASMNRANSAGAKSVKILQTTAVGSRERLVLVHYRGRDILLGVSAGGISVIHNEIDNEPTDGESVQHETHP